MDRDQVLKEIIVLLDSIATEENRATVVMILQRIQSLINSISDSAARISALADKQIEILTKHNNGNR